MLEAIYTASLNQVVIALDQKIPLAAHKAAKDESISLPSDQWKDEVYQLNSIMLAYIQALIVNYVTGPSFPEYKKYIVTPSTPQEQEFCDNQMVTNNNYFCFSTLGVAIILAVGGLIILLNLVLEPLIRLLRNLRRDDYGLYKQLEWDMTATLQLQRLVYEGQGSGTWRGEPDVVPVTSGGTGLGIPKWTGMGEANRISLGGNAPLGQADSPLMKGEGRIMVTEL